MKSPFKFAAARPERAPGSREIFPHMAKHVDEMAFIHSLLHRVEQPLAGPVQDQHRHDAGWASRASARGSPTAWAARARTCRRSSSMYDTLGRGLPKGHAQNWGAGFLPGVYPGHGAQAAGRRRSTTSTAAAGHDRRASSGRSSTCSAQLNRQHLRAARRRGRAGRPDRELRAGLPHADGRPRGARRRPASRSTIQQAVRPRQPEVRRTSPSSA